MYSGVINVYKEKGYTSFDVVAKLRGILKQKKIGHTGTLDPDAEGVLVVCLGAATKLCEILTDKDKCYETELLLGKTTDTEDSSGTVLSESKVTVTKEEVRKVIESFVGEYEQIPPMYSAIKVEGKKLYELARQGITVDRTPRRVVIHKIDIKEISLPYVTFTVSCGKGTYIRSLCRDIGEQLGCGAIMNRLVRNSVNAEETGNVFLKEEAFTISQIEEQVKAGTFEDMIIPIEDMFPRLLKVFVTAEGEKKLMNGNLLKSRDMLEEPLHVEDGQKIRVYDATKQFRAIYQYQKELCIWKADKMFL